MSMKAYFDEHAVPLPDAADYWVLYEQIEQALVPVDFDEMEMFLRGDVTDDILAHLIHDVLDLTPIQKERFSRTFYAIIDHIQIKHEIYARVDWSNYEEVAWEDHGTVLSVATSLYKSLKAASANLTQAAMRIQHPPINPNELKLVS